MNGLIYALALFGCSDDATFCERLEAHAPAFESRVACELAVDAAMQRDIVRRADHPSVVAKCMPQGTLLVMGDKPVDLTRSKVRLAVRD
ncbi:MAG: hypothetical protein R3D89_01730 [Sphingomonadaceae bacterium]